MEILLRCVLLTLSFAEGSEADIVRILREKQEETRNARARINIASRGATANQIVAERSFSI